MRVNHLVSILALVVGICAAQESCEYRNFTQNIDHFGNHNGTFQQQYSLITDFFKPGGPIMFFQGEESIYLDCANTTIMYEWAKELGGIAVSLEHRYFGPSKPFGPESIKLENLKYLTLDNVMMDAKVFLEWLKKDVEGAGSSKAIVASGSYGGFLVGAFRLNHPEAFYGAIASAGPVMSWGNESDPSIYNWWDWASRVYRDASFEASEKIKNAFEALEKRFASNDTDTLQKELNLCGPVQKSNLTQYDSILRNFLLIYTMAPEFNYPFVNEGRTPIALPLQETINIALNTSDPIQILSQSTNMWYERLGEECIDIENPAFQSKAVPLIERAYFGYITCTYCPVHASMYISNRTIFPARSVSSPTASCKLTYNVTSLTKEEMETRYHFSPAEIANSTRIIWSKGEYDPTSGVEPLAIPLSDDPMRSRTLEAVDVAHREDLFRSHPMDRDGVKMLRKKELEIIKGWLNAE